MNDIYRFLAFNIKLLGLKIIIKYIGWKIKDISIKHHFKQPVSCKVNFK